MKRTATALGIALLVVASVAVTVVLRAPAAWLGDWLEAHTKVRLIDARGTVWSGSALLGVSNGRETTLIPGRIEWQASALGVLQISHGWLAAPLVVSVSKDRVMFARGSARLPAGVLAGVGAPFNTLKPGGVLELAWRDCELRGAAMTGEVQIDWRNAQSALSTVAPLGSYRLRISGAGGNPLIALQTLAGPLQMEGRGTMEGSRIRFSGVATADPAMRSSLNGLMGLLGMRSGDKVLLAIDT